MDQQNITFYEKNKNSADLIYPHADGIVIYRKIVQTDGTVQIVEIKKYDDQQEQTIRNVPEHEMSAEYAEERTGYVSKRSLCSFKRLSRNYDDS